MKFQTKWTLDGLRNYFSNLNSILLKNLLASLKNYVFNYAIQHYMHFIQGDASHLINTTGINKGMILSRLNVCKATGRDELSWEMVYKFYENL